MKHQILISLVSLLTLSDLWGATNVAPVRLDCLSLRFSPATTTVLGLQYTLDLGTAEDRDGLNGELAPAFDPSQPSHGAAFVLNDPSFPEPLTGNLALQVPDVGDANGNGFSDFFEVSQAVPTAVTLGLYTSAVDNGGVSATWSRAAGSNLGTCQLKLTSHAFGELPELTAQFELIEYGGSLEYIPAATNVNGSVHLVQAGTPANRLEGLLHFSRSGTNRFDELELQPGTWTNAGAQTLTSTNAFIIRDTALRTNYYGFLDFDDGELGTAAGDYFTWQLSIDDPNDNDRDGIPDFTDDLPDANNGRLALRISLASDHAQLEINGETGRSYELQETASLREINWASVLSITLTNSVQIVAVPLTAQPTLFWRVKEK